MSDVTVGDYHYLLIVQEHNNTTHNQIATRKRMETGKARHGNKVVLLIKE